MPGNPELEQVDLQVTGMTCSSCVATIERSLNKVPGAKVTVNLATESAHVLVPRGTKSKELIDAVKSAGYSAKLCTDESESFSHSRKMGLRTLLAIIFTIPVIVISMVHSIHGDVDTFILTQLDRFGIPNPLYSPSGWLAIALTAPVVIFIAWPIHRAAIKNFLNPTMDTLVSLGSLITFVWSSYSAFTFDANNNSSKYIYAEVSAAVIFFVMLGRYLEHKAKRKARSALAELFKLSSSHVEIIDNGSSKIVPITELEIGSTFIVKPGEKIATDGVVISGSSTVNNSFLTGEFKPGS